MRLEVNDIIFNGLASSLALLTGEQKELGALAIDLGGGTTEYVMTSSIFEGLPPDFEPAEPTMSPPPLPTDAQPSEANPRSKPLSPGLIVAIIILAIIVIMAIINQTQKATHDRDFDQIMEGIQKAGQ